MTNFMKGMTFTMEGKEYEILSEGTNDPSSYLVYVALHENEGEDPKTLRIWKAEAKLARGDITINGHIDEEIRKKRGENPYPVLSDPLEQIADLKRRIMAIEERRLSLLKIDDPKGHALLQDNVFRPNKAFNIWDYTLTSGDYLKKSRAIQYIKIKGIIIGISVNSQILEHFSFNISDQVQPGIPVSDDTLVAEGRVKIVLDSQAQTIQGAKTRIIHEDLGGRIELEMDMGISCVCNSGEFKTQANFSKVAYIRDVNAPGLLINRIAFPEIGNHMVGIEGISADIYISGQELEENIYQ